MWCGTKFEDVTLCANISIISVCSAWEDRVISFFLLLVSRENIANVVLRGVVSRRSSGRRFVTYLRRYWVLTRSGHSDAKSRMSCSMKCEENRTGTVSRSKTYCFLKSYIVCLNMPMCFRSVWSHFAVATEIHTITTFERRTFIYLRS
jgi:hypothetical protein